MSSTIRGSLQAHFVPARSDIIQSGETTLCRPLEIRFHPDTTGQEKNNDERKRVLSAYRERSAVLAPLLSDIKIASSPRPPVNNTGNLFVFNPRTFYDFCDYCLI